MLDSRIDHPGTRSAMDSIDLVIFDCDGVLIDSEPIASRTLAETLQGAGIAISAAEAHVKFTGNSESIIAEMCRREYGISDVEALFERWHRHLFQEFERSLTPIAGIAEVVNNLDRPKCVASNSTMRRLRNSLGKLDLWCAFGEDVFSAEFVSRPKPAPDLLLHCAERFQARPGKSVMIDDSVHGVAAAIAAGMTAIGFVDPADPRPGRRAVLDAAGAAAVATGAGELTAILENVGGRL
ncbi:HAD-IA family hydrolase [Rhizobium sp. MC63]|uniref:HAD-IA family hydrolase n=1 Tax=Rhizobium mulingense TaxID=3031128 RepID=A0ACC6MTR0_9HYPH|nr:MULTISPECIES: HAD-IA family hydrolase [unclassified Rhizobium]MDF0697053.1 HAD-IA family hydrolase [Rhizobium sp. MC63]MEA3516719.1 HAD-IA family hydrolase [Rhizobium sp. MJ31]